MKKKKRKFGWCLLKKKKKVIKKLYFTFSLDFSNFNFILEKKKILGNSFSNI